jgi:hypothetical protein
MMPNYCVTITGATFEIKDVINEEDAREQAFALCDVSIEEMEPDKDDKDSQ